MTRVTTTGILKQLYPERSKGLTNIMANLDGLQHLDIAEKIMEIGPHRYITGKRQQAALLLTTHLLK
jgi:hypothetical protein